ncbi:MAG: type II secretion system minor pseudopilin GspH [Gammaproteobacteria bacterium]|nr:type II secretion system minor pseudopilin GspH [Gammaproteobacteria bacterium]
MMYTARRQHGFTLIEILVVVIIIATVSGIALMSIGLIGDDKELSTERQRLASLIEVAQDEATLQGREFGLELMTSTYRFVEFDPFASQWSEILGDDLFRLRQLPEGMEFELYVEDKRVLLADDPKALEDPDDDSMARTTEKYAPHIFVFSSGELTAYEIRIRRPQQDQQLVMRGDILGEIEFVDEEE